MAGSTFDDIARAVGFHPSTVSRALNPDRAGLVKPDMVARGLWSGRTATIGVIVADPGNPFVTPIIHKVAAP